MNDPTPNSATRTEPDMKVPGAPIPCRWCGIVVEHPDPSTLVTSLVQGRGLALAAQRAFYVETALCERHAKVWARAGELAERHPRLRRAHGGLARERLAAGLLGLELAAVGPFRPRLGNLADDPAALLLLIGVMAPIGGDATWAAAGIRSASRSRWAHLDKELRHDANVAYRVYMERLFEVPMPFGPPTGGLRGCIYCGVGEVRVKPSQEARAWGREYSVDSSVLTPGESRGGTVRGHLCLVCRRSVRDEAIGLPTLQRAVLAAAGWELRGGYTLTAPPVYAWSTLGPDYGPNNERWQHLDLAALAAGMGDLRDRGIARRIGDEWPVDRGGFVGWFSKAGAVDQNGRPIR